MSTDSCVFGFNRLITSSPIVIFLGAGASAGVGKPTMVEFVEKLKRNTSLASGQELLCRLAAARSDNLELILADLEGMLSLPYVTSFRCDVSSEEDTEEPSEITRDEAVSLRSVIRHEIIREYRTIDRDAVLRSYEPLFDLIFKYVNPKQHCVPIFTTNYDLAIETLCEVLFKYNHTEGLELDPISKTAVWKRSQFDSYSLWEGHQNLVQFKLHGSVDWIRLEKSGSIVRAPAMYDILDSDEYQNAIIYPTGDKAANREPYFSAYEYFSRCCEQAVILLVIGYSFRDYETLSRLRGAHGRNEGLKVVLLAPDAWGLTRVFDSEPNDPYSTFRLAVTPVAKYFGRSEQQEEYLQSIEKELKRLSANTQSAQ